MSRFHLTQALRVFYGKARYPRALALNFRPGVQITPELYWHDFGAPATADADGVCASQSVTASVAALINGALASGGVATFDVPRAVVAAWTNTAVCTVTGTDEYGSIVIESSASGTSMTGVKAFKTITSVTFSANVTGATVGSSDVLGLPYRVDANGLIAARSANAADTGTFVPAVTTDPATATTGDVRGTFNPSATVNGSNRVAVLIKVADPSTKVGAYGVKQYGSTDGE